jgi:acyl-CoA synthetase (AMP-forming)/AMP-acid ligase II
VDPSLPLRVLVAEDLLESLSPWALARALLGLCCLPARFLDRSRPDDMAALVSCLDDAQRVELTHRQMFASLDAVMEGFDLQRHRDVVCNALPLSHGFGLVLGHWLGLTQGLQVVAPGHPADGQALGRLVEAGAATLLLATPALVRGWMQSVEAQRLRTLRLVVVSEGCPAELGRAFKERFGRELLEAYQCPGLAGMVASNLPTATRDGFSEVRSREGSVGRTLPGMQVFAIDRHTRRMLPTGCEGLLMVRCPARRCGPLDRPGAATPADDYGACDTGDAGSVDDDGFIHITGRQDGAGMAGAQPP